MTEAEVVITFAVGFPMIAIAAYIVGSWLEKGER